MEPPTGQRRHPGEAHAVWMLWITYGSFYLCRSNLSAALPGIELELSLTKAQLGPVLASLKIAYAAGQFINGQLAERVSPKILLAVGMFSSACLSAIFGLGTGFYFFLFVWAMNGYSQALGWAPAMRVAANWLPAERRGRAVGVIGTGYLAAGAATFVIAGMAAELFGWRGALWLPAILLFLSAIHTAVFLRERPPAVGAPPGDSAAPARELQPLAKKSAGHVLLDTLANPRLWLLAVALGLLNANRYGFLDWGITHLVERQGQGGVGVAALKYAVLPLGGIAGCLVAGWATDRFFAGRRIPVIAGLLMALAGLTLAYNHVVEVSTGLSVVVLALVGFCMFGPQVLLVGASPLDFARRGSPAAAVGFVNAFGYVGASAGDVVTGQLTHSSGWGSSILFWALCAVGAAVVLLPIWRLVPTPEHG